MSFDKTPTTWLANWSEDDTNITVPLATFPELTAAEADATDGDIRKIVFAIIEKLWSTYNATATADRPVKWTMAKAATVNTVRNVLTSRYTITLETEIGTQEVVDETSSSPTATATATPTSTSTATASSTATSTSTASSSATWSISGSDTASHTQSASSTASATSTGTSTASATPTSTTTSSSTATATATI